MSMRMLAALSLVAVCLAFAGRAVAEDRQFTLVNIEYEGTKVWAPGTLVVQKGDYVTIKLINNVKSDPNEHGFAIPAFELSAVVARGEPETVHFSADKAGIFPINCQLHPVHIGGQLVVLDQPAGVGGPRPSPAGEVTPPPRGGRLS